MDLVKKKNVSLTPEVHANLMRVVAAIQAKSGVNTTANDAVRALLDKWNEDQMIADAIDICIKAFPSLELHNEK